MVNADHPGSRTVGRLAARLRRLSCGGALRLILVATVCVLPSCNSDNAANHTLVINGAVHVYSDPNPPAVYPGSNFLEVLGPKDKVKVQQVVYRNGYMAVKIKLNDGREGWVFSGESIELK
jgi:hypothetical protein